MYGFIVDSLQIVNIHEHKQLTFDYLKPSSIIQKLFH